MTIELTDKIDYLEIRENGEKEIEIRKEETGSRMIVTNIDFQQTFRLM
jgi:hypothetical protein